MPALPHLLAPMDSLKQGVDLAAEISKQLITLSTAILALTITFARPFLKTATARQRRLIVAAWCSYLLVILFALWHLSALAGNLLKPVSAHPDLASAKLPAILQMGAFICATLFFVWFAVSSSRSSSSRSAGASSIDTVP